MIEWTDQAIILRHGYFHEAHVWLRVLSRSHGILTLFAFGGRKSRRRFCGCLDVFNTILCHVKSSGRNAYLALQEASLTSGVGNLRQNWRNMGLAANCLMFLHSMEIDEEAAPDCFKLCEELRDFLQNAKACSIYLPLYFRLHCASLLGFSPQLDLCGKCGRKLNNERSLFLAGEGRVFCAECSTFLLPMRKRAGNWLNPAALNQMRLAAGARPDAWLDAHLSQNDRRSCVQAIQAFIEYHFDIGRQAWRMAI